MPMKRSVIYAACLALFLTAFVTGCEKESEKKNKAFEGVGRLISDRNKARYDAAEQQSSGDGSASRTEKAPPSTLYQESVEIVSTSSKRTLGKGVAYLDKEGKIVYIKIKKQ